MTSIAHGYSVVLTTIDGSDRADTLARAIVESKLGACVQVHPVRSYYTWKGSLSVEPEHLLLIKTRRELYPRLEAFIRERHSYETPEIVQLDVANGLPAYLAWIDDATNA